jgi:hypothetical protein
MTVTVIATVATQGCTWGVSLRGPAHGTLRTSSADMGGEQLGPKCSVFWSELLMYLDCQGPGRIYS